MFESYRARHCTIYDFTVQAILQSPNARTRPQGLSIHAAVRRMSFVVLSPALFDHVQGAGTRGPKRACTS